LTEKNSPEWLKRGFCILHPRIILNDQFALLKINVQCGGNVLVWSILQVFILGGSRWLKGVVAGDDWCA